ncbi:propionyl-CoA synthetase, partial [Salmonella enterica]
AVAFGVPKQGDTLADGEAGRDEEKGIMGLVDDQIGHFGRPGHVWLASQLPNTRSSTMLRPTIQPISEGRDPGAL